MSYTGQNPKFRSTILTDIGLASIPNPAAGSHRIINRGGTLQVQDDTGLETAIGAGGTVDRITQVGHGFVEGEILYYTGSAYAKANANTSATAEALGMVSRVIDSDTFELTLEGKVTGLSGLTAGEVYFLSASTAGAITITEPTALGYVSLPIGVAISATDFYVKSSRGAVVGSTNARTEISLANNAVTNVQNISAYDAGELTGWVSIDGTTDSKFYVSAPFAKNGAGSDYNISPQYVGDTPPVGFSMSVTSGGVIQVTMPSIAGYVAAKINFALNAPAVGAIFPLAIDSTLVQYSVLKAKDSSGFVFQENGGTQIGSISDSGSFTLGSSTVNHRINGNIGISRDVTSGWGSFWRTIEGEPSSGLLLSSANVNSVGMISNLYATNSDFRYSSNGAGSLNVVNATGFEWLTASSGTAGNAATLNTVGQCNNSGAWTFGPTSNTLTHKFNGNSLRIETSGTNTAALDLRSTGGNSAVSFSDLTNATPNRYNFNYVKSTDVLRIDGENGITNLAEVNQSGLWKLNGGVQLLSTGASPSTLNFYATSSISTTYTFNSGGPTTSSETIYITRIGNVVTITQPNGAGTASSAASSTQMNSNTPLPTWARPSALTWHGLVYVNFNALTDPSPGSLRVDTDGIIYIRRRVDASVAWGGADNGSGVFSFTYIVF
jgi:hypothetical protein